MNRYEPSTVTAALTGGDVLPSQSEHLPRGAKGIADEAVAAARAGAAVVHLHARDDSGRPSASSVLYRRIADEVRSRCDAVLNVTTGGAPGMTVVERLAGVRAVAPELATLNLGTMNYEAFPDPARWPRVVSDWERDVLRETGHGTLVNTLAMLREFAAAIYDVGATPELEAYDLGHVQMARFLIDEGTLRPPVRMQLVLGVLGGAGNSVDDLTRLRHAALDILGTDLASLGVAAVGFPMQLRHCAVALSLGMDCRVGMEDSLRVERDRPVRSNAELVAAAIELARLVGRPLATAQDVRERLAHHGSPEGVLS